MVAKESVRARFERPDQGITYTEFSYMLLQAYDFLRLHDDHGCRLQIGGSDQWGNITTGMELIRKVGRAEAFGLTTPLVTKADGTKFGKTESGTVWLDPAMTSPYRLYQFLLQSEDAVVGQYLRFFTFLAPRRDRRPGRTDRRAPRAPGRPERWPGPWSSWSTERRRPSRAERASAALFGEELGALDERTLLDVFDDAPSSDASRQELVDGLSLVEAMVATGLVASRGEARRTIAQGGAYVNNLRQGDEARVLTAGDLLHDRYLVLRRGRRDYHLLRIG